MTTPSYIPRLLMSPDDVTTIVEESSVNLTSDASGNVAFQQGMTLSALSAFATQWLAIYNEWKTLQIQFKYHSRSGSSTTGALVMYLERDEMESVVPSLAAAYREQESQEFRPWDDFVTSPKLTTLQWKPKEPSDDEFNRSATDIQVTLMVAGEGLPASTTFGTVQIVARIQFRGRRRTP